MPNLKLDESDSSSEVSSAGGLLMDPATTSRTSSGWASAPWGGGSQGREGLRSAQ